MKITAVIPARYASTRFPGKALADIGGKPMIQHVYERTCTSSLITRVIVATDDQRIADAVTRIGGETVMTSAAHETGTDRLAEVARGLDSDLIVNVQGDEPLIDPAMIDQAIEPFLSDPDLQMGTLKTRVLCLHDFLSPNVVKVVTDVNGYALYFSRSPLPFFRDKWKDLKDDSFACGKMLCFYTGVCRHVADISGDLGEARTAARDRERRPYPGGGDRVHLHRCRYAGGPEQGPGAVPADHVMNIYPVQP